MAAEKDPFDEAFDALGSNEGADTGNAPASGESQQQHGADTGGDAGDAGPSAQGQDGGGAADSHEGQGDGQGDDEQSLRAELEKLNQRYKSAEGRFKQFGNWLEETENRIKQIQAQLGEATGAEGGEPSRQSSDDSGGGQDTGPSDSDASETAGSGERPEDYIAEYREDLPEAAKAQEMTLEKLRELEQNQQATKQMLQEVQAERERREQEEFNNRVRAVHRDFDDFLDPTEVENITDWASRRDDPLERRAYLEAIQSGDPPEVIQVISHYKQDTGKGEPPVSQGASQDSQAQARADDALAPPPSRGQAPPPGTGVAAAPADDFDAGYDEARKRKR